MAIFVYRLELDALLVSKRSFVSNKFKWLGTGLVNDPLKTTLYFDTRKKRLINLICLPRHFWLTREEDVGSRLEEVQLYKILDS